MIIGILVILYTFMILAIYGYGTISLLLKNKPEAPRPSLFLILVLGLVVVTTLASFSSLFMRINWEFQSSLALGAGVISFFVLRKNPKLIKFNFGRFNLAQKVGAVFLTICLILTFLQALQEPTNPDTGIYHAQTIHWIESYPAVPGLANLQIRFGYNSSWLLANAIFSFAFLGFQSFHLLSGFLFLVMVISFYKGIHNLLAKKFLLSNFIRLGFFLALFFFIFDQVSSPGTDSPVTLLLWFILAETTGVMESRQRLDQNLDAFILILLCIFLTTIKLSTAPILLLPLFWIIYILIKKNTRFLVVSIVASTIIFIPFIVRNLIQTGYPVFPGFSTNLFHFDWALSEQRVSQEGPGIHWFAMLSSVPMDDFLKMSFREQTDNWFANLIPRYKAILLTIPAGFLFNLLLCVFKKWRAYIFKNPALPLLIMVCLAGDVFWFISAPAVRFGFGFLLGSVFLVVFPAVCFIANQFKSFQKIIAWGLLVLVVGLAVVNFRTVIRYDDLSKIIMFPRDYPQWSSEPCDFYNFNILCQASYESCWYSPFPCAIQGNMAVEMRGSDFRDGFRLVP